MGLLDRPRAAALAARSGWVSGGAPNKDGISPSHAPLRTMDNRALMEAFEKDLGGAPLGSMLSGGWQSSLTNLYRTGPGRLRSLANSYGGTSDSVSWVFSCTSLVASTMASYPWRLVDDENETVENPPADLVALLRRPNPKWTYFDLMEAVATDLELVGNAYILKNEMSASGKPKSLYRLRPDMVRIATKPDGTILGFVYSPQQGVAIPYDASEVIHFRYPNPLDDYYGMGTVEAIASVLDRTTAAGLHLTGFYQNGARISGILSIPETLSDVQYERLKQSYLENYSGPANAFKLLIAEKGGDFKPVTQTGAGTGTIDLMKLDKDETLAAFGIPAPLLGGVMENANYKMEESQHIFTRAMIPRTRRVSERASVDLIYDVWGMSLSIDAHANEPLEVRIGHAKEMLLAGATLNQALEAAGLPASDHPMADTPLIPNSVIPIDIAGQPPRPGRSIPMGDVGEPGSPPAPGTPGAPPEGGSNGKPTTPLQDAVAQLPEEVRAKLADLDEEEDADVAASLAGAVDEARKAIARVSEVADRSPSPEPAQIEAEVAEEPEPELRSAPTGSVAVAPRRSARSAVRDASRAWGGPTGRRPSPEARSGRLPPSGARKDWEPPELPRGFEAPSAKAADRADVQAIREHQARTYRVGVDTFEPAFRRFFKAERDRVLQALSAFGAGERSARLRHAVSKAKGDLTGDAIFDAAAENEALQAAYLPALDEVGAVAAETPPSLAGAVAWDLSNPAIAAVRDRMAKLVTRVNDTTREEISTVVSEGMRRGYSISQIANGYSDEKYGGVMGVFDHATDVRAETIARSESAMAFGWSTALSYRDAGVETVEILDGEGDDACAEANGSVWTLDEYEANPIEHPNCSRAAVPSDSSATEGGDGGGDG